MTISQRSFLHESDKYLMAALARQFSENNPHVTDLPHRLSSWAFDNPENVSLWFDDGGLLAAWAVLQTPFWTIDYVCHPAVEANLHPDILQWADQRARLSIDTPNGRPSWYVDVFSGQTSRMADFEKAGYQCQANVGEDSWSKVLMRRSTETPVKIYRPPAGFTVRSLAGENEVEDYVNLHRSVFGSTNMTVDWRRRILKHPAYKPELDVVVASPDGRLGAFCVCWFDEDGAVGRIEPLGCHKDFRRYALGRVALSEGIHRLETLGAKAIYVETDSYRNTALMLYQSFDFEVKQDILVYRKDFC